MAERLILIDTSILIYYYRKTDKENSAWLGLVREGYRFCISSITKYEIYSGATETQMNFWNNILQFIAFISFDENAVDTAITLNATLKKQRKQIGLADLFIGATAVTNNIPLATLNKKHFSRIDNLKGI